MDASSGTGLAQTIKGKYASAVRLIKAELNKDIRLFLQQAKFEQGRVFFPKWKSPPRCGAEGWRKR